jgi:FkbM family methyltransferase
MSDLQQDEHTRLRGMPRYERATSTLMGQPIQILDAESFLIMHEEIVEQAIYAFHADGERPYIIDGGANIGVSVMYFKEVHPGARVVAFEADSDAFSLLEKNVESRGYKDVTLVYGALSDAEGVASFMAEGSYAGRLSRGDDEISSSVPTVRLRPYLDRRVDLLKLNIEGAETAVLADCADLLDRVERIILEYHSFADEPQSLHTLTTILANAGYRLYVRSVSHSWPLQPLIDVPVYVGMDLQLYVYAYRDGAASSPRGTPAVHVETVQFGDLRRLTPVSTEWGYDRGTPVDRYYIERFLAEHSADVRGRVLEVGDDSYTRQYGDDRVEVRDVLHVREGAPGATIVADLTDADHIPSNAFDCIIFTQTLHLIYDTRAALRTLHRILKPGGVLLATFPGISQIDHGEWADTWYWSFTSRSARRLFGEIFADVAVEPFGNVLVATSFLQGLAWQELRPEELDHRDAAYELVITVRAVKKEPAP